MSCKFTISYLSENRIEYLHLYYILTYRAYINVYIKNKLYVETEPLFRIKKNSFDILKKLSSDTEHMQTLFPIKLCVVLKSEYLFGQMDN